MKSPLTYFAVSSVKSRLVHHTYNLTRLRLNLWHTDVWYVEISTEMCTCYFSRCTIQLISQQPLMIETCLNFLNTLSVDNDSLCIFRQYLNKKRLFKVLVNIVACSMLKIKLMLSMKAKQGVKPGRWHSYTWMTSLSSAWLSALPQLPSKVDRMD